MTRHVIAVASDVPLNLDVALLDINDVEGLADFVVEVDTKSRTDKQKVLDQTQPVSHRPFLHQRKKAQSSDWAFGLFDAWQFPTLAWETPHYHRRYGVSLLSSAWGQVGPPR